MSGKFRRLGRCHGGNEQAWRNRLATETGPLFHHPNFRQGTNLYMPIYAKKEPPGNGVGGHRDGTSGVSAALCRNAPPPSYFWLDGPGRDAMPNPYQSMPMGAKKVLRGGVCRRSGRVVRRYALREKPSRQVRAERPTAPRPPRVAAAFPIAERRPRHKCSCRSRSACPSSIAAALGLASLPSPSIPVPPPLLRRRRGRRRRE